MGTSNAQIYLVILVLLCGSIPVWELAAQHQENETFIIHDFRHVENDQDSGRPKRLIYGDKAEKMSVIVNLDQVRIEWLGNNREDVNAVLSTSSAVYNYATKTVQGEKAVAYRSPRIDVDGVGFDIDEANQIIHIRDQVKVIIRTGDAVAAGREQLQALTAARNRQTSIRLKGGKIAVQAKLKPAGNSAINLAVKLMIFLAFIAIAGFWLRRKLRIKAGSP